MIARNHDPPQNDDGWTKRWTKSSEWKKKSEMGKWEHTTGKWYSKDHPDDKGIQTSQDARFYGLSALMDEPFTQSEGQDLVLQYTVKFEQQIDCKLVDTTDVAPPWNQSSILPPSLVNCGNKPSEINET